MASWISLHVPSLFLMITALLLDLCQGGIECICTTEECVREGETSCVASQWCYVEILPRDGATFGRDPAIHRGCIDDRTPLLCENRARPQSYTGSWPVLHCCQSAWCNKDVLPTIPTWMKDLENKPSTKRKPLPEGSIVYTNTESYQPWPPSESEDTHSKQDVPAVETYGDSYQYQGDNQYTYNDKEKLYQQSQSTRRKSRTRTINPLYIGVPIAGGCVLLGIIIFAIYLLKRQNQYIEEYRYHSALRYPGHGACVMATDPRDPCMHCTCTKKQLYAECERSSSGSETKLLMKV